MARPTWSWPRSGRPVTRVPSQQDAWGCPSILVSSPVLAFILIYNSDHPLGAGVNMDVLDHDGLAVPAPAPIEGLEQVVLEFDQFVGVAAVDRDVLLAEMTLAELEHAERGEARDDELHTHQSIDLGLRLEGGDRRQGCVERRLLKEVVGV